MDLSSLVKVSSLILLGLGVLAILVAALRKRTPIAVAIFGILAALFGLGGMLSGRYFAPSTNAAPQPEPQTQTKSQDAPLAQPLAEQEEAPLPPLPPPKAYPPAEPLALDAVDWEGSQELEVAECIASESVLALNQEVEFSALFPGEPVDGASIQWDFDDSGYALGVTAKHRYRKVGEYLVIANRLLEDKSQALAFCTVRVCRPTKSERRVKRRISGGTRDSKEAGEARKDFACSKLDAQWSPKVRVRGEGCQCEAELVVQGEGLQCSGAKASTDESAILELELSCEGQGDFAWKLERRARGGEGCTCKWSTSKLLINEE